MTIAAPLVPAAGPVSAPATEPDFQVSRRPGSLLVYVKDHCRDTHTVAPFFLHITPTATADLPPDRRRYGFEARDFYFTDVGFRTGNYGGRHCIVERLLPDYPIAHLRTGQYNPAGEIWSTEMSFPE